MQVYVINLDRDRDRLTHMQRQLRAVAFIRVPGHRRNEDSGGDQEADAV